MYPECLLEASYETFVTPCTTQKQSGKRRTRRTRPYSCLIGDLQETFGRHFCLLGDILFEHSDMGLCFKRGALHARGVGLLGHVRVEIPVAGNASSGKLTSRHVAELKIPACPSPSSRAKDRLPSVSKVPTQKCAYSHVCLICPKRVGFNYFSNVCIPSL